MNDERVLNRDVSGRHDVTAICYPDCRATSTSGRFTLEARSPDNGTIVHRDGRRPSESDFGYKYRQHQSEFRYRLLEDTRRVVWERWQQTGEDSPHELMVSDDGWSILRTHGFRPEVVVVSPAGDDVLRVHVTGPGSKHRAAGPPDTTLVFVWRPEHLAFTTAGLFWTGHSWRYFLRYDGSSLFGWRTWWGQRLVLDLGRATVLPDNPQLPSGVEQAIVEEEKRGLCALLAELSARMGEVRQLLARRQDEETAPHPLSERLSLVTAALHLAGVYRLAECVPLLRQWEAIDCPSSSQGSDAMAGGWWRESQRFRPVAQHSLRLLGVEPQGFATYHFTNFLDNKRRFRAPERVPDRASRRAGLKQEMSAEEVLGLLGSPDYIRNRVDEPGTAGWRITEDWEYDLLASGQWVTLRVTWEARGGGVRMRSGEEVPPYWLQSNEREAEFLGPW